MNKSIPAHAVARAPRAARSASVIALAALLCGSVVPATAQQCHNSDFGGKIGYYGKAWAQALADEQATANFVILQVDIDNFADGPALIKQLQARGVTIFARMNFWNDTNERVSASDSEIQDNYSSHENKILRTVDALERLGVHAGSLDEENIGWNGRAEILSSLYDAVKRKHPHFQVYQWFSPSTNSTVPGGRWPKLPADGWVLGSYFLQPALYRQVLDGYLALGKPVISYVWASPTWQIDKSVPKEAARGDFWNASERRRSDQIVSINESRCVATAFFVFDRVGGGPKPLFAIQTPEAQAFLKDLDGYMRQHSGSTAAAKLPGMPQWRQ